MITKSKNFTSARVPVQARELSALRAGLRRLREQAQTEQTPTPGIELRGGVGTAVARVVEAVA